MTFSFCCRAQFSAASLYEIELGNLAEARDFLVKGLELSARKTPDGIPQDWIEPLTARLLIQEAKTAVGGHVDTAAQAK